MASTFYEVLGVSQFASDADIKKAFKTLAKKYHPDKNPGVKFYEEHFKKVNEAYQTLSNPQARKTYDFRMYYAANTPPRPQQKTQTNPKRNNPYTQKQTARPNYKKPQASRSTASQKKLNTYYIYIAIGAIVFIFFSVWFYNFMNDYASKEYYAEGLKEEKKGNSVQAMSYFFASLEKDYDNPIVNEKVGDIYTTLAHNNSLELFYFDLELQKKDIDPSLDKESEGMLRNMQGIDSLAIMYYNRALENYELDTDKRRVGLKLVRTDLKIGNTTQAETNINKVEQYPDTNRDDSVLFYKADIQFQMKNYAAARQQYTSFSGLHSNSYDARIKIALCHFNEHNEDYALAQLEKAIKHFPSKGEAYYFKGEILRRNRDLATACYLFYKADSLHVLAAKPALFKYCEN